MLRLTLLGLVATWLGSLVRLARARRSPATIAVRVESARRRAA